MKIINPDKIGAHFGYRAVGVVFCGLCRSTIPVGGGTCRVCGNALSVIANVDVSVRLSADLFDSMYPAYPDVFDKTSDHRAKLLRVGPLEDTISSAPLAAQRAQQRTCREHLVRSMVPRRYWGKTPSDFRGWEQLPASVRSVLQTGFQDVLYLWGPNNTGKTLLASILIQEQLRQGAWPLYFLTPTDIVSAKLGRHERGPAYKGLLRARLAVLDDLADPVKTYENGLVLPFLDEWLRYRVHNCLPTILTANKPIIQLVEQGNWHQIGKLIERGYISAHLQESPA